MAESKGGGEGGERLGLGLGLGLLFILYPIFHCHKIKDGGYNNTNTNKVPPTQNMPALQARTNLNKTGRWSSAINKPKFVIILSLTRLKGTVTC